MKIRIVWISFITPLILSAIFSLLYLFTFYHEIDMTFFRFFHFFMPDVPVNEDILLIEIDDKTIESGYYKQWDRSPLADALLALKEFDADAAVMDIDFTYNNPITVSGYFFQEAPDLIEFNLIQLESYVNKLLIDLQSGKKSLVNLNSYLEEYSSIILRTKYNLFKTILDRVKKNDLYFAQAEYYFGNVYLPVFFYPEQDQIVEAEQKELVKEMMSQFTVLDKTFKIEDAVNISFPVLSILDESKSVGFSTSNLEHDKDLYKTGLFIRYEDMHLPHLVLTALIHKLKCNETIINNNSIVLNKEKPLLIPLTEEGEVYLNWPKKPASEYFRCLSFFTLMEYKKTEMELVITLNIMKGRGYLTYYSGEIDLLNKYNMAEEIKTGILEGGDIEAISVYQTLREDFFKEVEEFLFGDAEDRILDDINSLLESIDEEDEQAKEKTLELAKDISHWFKLARKYCSSYINIREKLKQKLNGSICFIGININKEYFKNSTGYQNSNIDDYAVLANTILTESFITEVPLWISIITAFYFSSLLIFFLQNLKTNHSVMLASGFIVFFLLAGVILFCFNSIYFRITAPLLSCTFSILAFFLYRFFKFFKLKLIFFLRLKHNFSPDNKKIIWDKPYKLNLSGEKREVTILVTEIKGFSSILESQDANSIVKVLNYYFTKVSGTIQRFNGTINNFSEDSVISYFGAPVYSSYHARAACQAALKIKEMEPDINRYLAGVNTGLVPIYSRIGISTDIVILGNLGSDKIINYGILGKGISKAFWIEKINIQYGTSILLTENTYNQLKDDFILRKLDRIRTADIKEPVRLYELVSAKKTINPQQKLAVKRFHNSLALFEQQSWDKAEEGFNSVLIILPTDGPSELYLKRCEEFKNNPPHASWDGIFNLSVK
jgi:adenylate cyclase